MQNRKSLILHKLNYLVDRAVPNYEVVVEPSCQAVSHALATATEGRYVMCLVVNSFIPKNLLRLRMYVCVDHQPSYYK